ncbi:MAG: AAA family ATPase [Negativicutes bacterium]
MKVTRTEIRRFRKFNDINLMIGRMLTVIAGTNATGKSTLLAMLGNSCALEISTRYRSRLIRHSYRTEFSEIIRGSQPREATESNLYKIHFDDGDYRNHRITWQDDRFRLIPYKDIHRGRRTHAKKEHPVIYLGLSRLFPVGEASQTGCQTEQISLTPEEDAWYKTTAQSILTMLESIDNVDKIDIAETKRKQGIGFTTQTYGPLTNSAGQDNLGQILYAILAFRRLKEHLAERYQGGLLLIDELDATLHPAAQTKLIDTLIRACREEDIQIVVTTQSLSLLENIYPRTFSNVSTGNNNIELVYLSNVNGPIEITHDADPEMIRHEMMASCRATAPPPKILVYSEDNEARWFLRGLLNQFNNAIHIVDQVSLGWREYLKLIEGDPLYFNNVIIVLDGDASREPSVQARLGTHNSSLVLLPGAKRPEEVVRDFLLSLTDTDEYLTDPQVRQCGYNITFFRHEDFPTQGQPREQYKEWFNTHVSSFTQTGLLDHWMSKNPQLVQLFIDQFKAVYNKIAKRRNIRVI